MARLCDDAAIAGGEGARADWILANSRFRAVLRHPLASLTLAGLGGGTVVDAAPWGAPDRLHEVAPLLGEGWLVVDDVDVGDDHVTLRGVLRALPGRAVPEAGTPHEVTWSIRPDEPWLRLDGADGLWLHPSDAPRVIGGWSVHERVVYGHDGRLIEDLGGALRVEGATGLLVAPPEEAWRHARGSRVHVAGAAPGADAVEVLDGDEVVAWLPVREGCFEGFATHRADRVRAIAEGRPPSPAVAPGEGLELAVGAPATVALRLAWRGLPPRPARVRWGAADGRTGDALLEPTGGVVRVGAGVVELEVSAGPWAFPRQFRVELQPDEVLELPVALDAAVAPRSHVAADLVFRGTRSRAVRASAQERARAAVSAGLEFVVFTAEDVVEQGAAWADDVPRLRWEDGATLTSPAGWTVGGWPWRGSDRKSGRGAPYVAAMTPMDALRQAWGGEAVARTTIVDLPWLLAVTEPPQSLSPAPDFVELGPPGAPPFEAWSPWFRWLDAGRFVRPAGPRVWIDVVDRFDHGGFDLDRGLIRGWLSAGSGPLVRILVDGVGPGGVVRPPTPDTDGDSAPAVDTAAPGAPRTHGVAVEVDRGANVLDRVAIVTQGRGVVAELGLTGERTVWTGTLELGTWTLAVAWSTTQPDSWGVCMPVWTSAPGSGTVPGAWAR